MASSGAKPVCWELWNYGVGSWVRVQLHGFVVLLILFVLQQQLTALEAADAETRLSADNVTSLPVNHTRAHNATMQEGHTETSHTTTPNVTMLDGHTETSHTEKDNTGTVVAVTIICILLCIIIIVAVYFFRRKRQFRMMDKEKKMQIQMSSARNAGVYQDLTVSVPGDEKPPSPEHERLKAAEDV